MSASSTSRTSRWMKPSGFPSSRPFFHSMSLPCLELFLLAPPPPTLNRFFLTKFSLVGETQEIDRVVEQFSRRYFEECPGSVFKNWSMTSNNLSRFSPFWDHLSSFPNFISLFLLFFFNSAVVHTLVSSVLILNTDLHSGMVEKKMTKNDFAKNTNMALQDDEQLPDDYLKVSFFFSRSLFRIQLLNSTTIWLPFSIRNYMPRSRATTFCSHLTIRIPGFHKLV